VEILGGFGKLAPDAEEDGAPGKKLGVAGGEPDRLTVIGDGGIDIAHGKLHIGPPAPGESAGTSAVVRIELDSLFKIGPGARSVAFRKPGISPQHIESGTARLELIAASISAIARSPSPLAAWI